MISILLFGGLIVIMLIIGLISFMILRNAGQHERHRTGGGNDPGGWHAGSPVGAASSASHPRANPRLVAPG